MSSYELTVQVRTRYLPKQSEPEQGNYIFAYITTIRSTDDAPSQLISRRWVVTDAEEQVQEVNGLGMVDYQPLLSPGESFEYTSWATTRTPMGTMRGEYSYVTKGGHRFETPTPKFTLVMPHMLR